MSNTAKWILGFVLIFIAIGYITSKQNAEKYPARPVQNSSYDGAVYQAENYLKKHLKDPDSYQSIDWYKVVEINGTNDAGQHAAYMVKHKYRAKNGFGGYNVQMATFYLDSLGNVVTMKTD